MVPPEHHLHRTSTATILLTAAILFAVFFAARCEAKPEPSPDPDPTFGIIGRRVTQWVGEGVKSFMRDEIQPAIKERLKSLFKSRAKARQQRTSADGAELPEDGVADQDSSAQEKEGDDQGESLPSDDSPTKLLGRLLVNVVNALQRPDGIVDHLRNKVGFLTYNYRMSCYACELTMTLVRQMVYANRTDDEAGATFNRICRLVAVTSDRVCEGLVEDFLPEIMYVMRNIDMLDEEVCGFLLAGNCIGRTYKDTFGWTINVPAPLPPDQPLEPTKRKPYSNKLKVLHITDVHIDPYYTEGSTVDCGEPLCCRDKKRIYEPGQGMARAGKWGTPGRCDTPKRTLESLMEYLKENHEIDYILYTGDTPPHDIWQQSKEESLFLVKEFNRMLTYYFPDIPIYSSIGNHENSPVNSFPPPYVKGDYSTQYLYNALNSSWARMTKGNMSDTVTTGGYYSVLAREDLRIISLNTNYCNNKNWWMLLDSKDPAGQLKWLVDELETAERNNEKVHIIGHIPPGDIDCAYIWSDNFHKIVTRFKETITAQFYGHTHNDEFEIVYDKYDPKVPINIAYITPSVSPYGGVNPAFRIFYIDGDYEGSPREVMDYETYYLDLDDANTNDFAKWDILYSAKDAFNLRSLHPKEWDRFLTKMSNQDDFFQSFYRYSHRGGGKKTCEGRCKETLLCRLKKSWAGASKEC